MKSIVDMAVTIGGYLWGMPLIVCFLGSGLIFSIALRFTQIRNLKEMVKLLFNGEDSEKGLSSFQAFALAIAGRVGTGNIAGVATAICYGGPGALFWMWVVAIVGAGISFVEGTVAQLYKEEINGEYRGGGPFYIRKGLKMDRLAKFFAVAFILTMILTQTGLHANAMASAVEASFGIKSWICGIVIIALLAVVIIGGVKRIGSVAEKVVPFMAGAYILMALIVIGLNINMLPSVIKLIFTSAFGQDQIIGAAMGTAMIWGTKRAVFSSDAGLSTASPSAGCAEVSHPIKQGMVQSFSIYIDTLFVCSATGFMMLMTNCFNVLGTDGQYLVNNLGDMEAGPVWVQAALNSQFATIGGMFIAVEMFIFGYTTILNLYYGSETNLALFYSGKRQPAYVNTILRIVYLAFTFYGTVLTASDVWNLSDACLGVLLWINMITLCMLAKKVVRLLRDYEAQKKAGLDPIFDPEQFDDIANTESWIPIRDRYMAKRKVDEKV
ncbi:alanine/glycine:cation symporter family protein [Emergencia sp.]|uniref:alanine/glycine:cation symporter family protein n=1 Tax=Emergencia sp. TaxID=1926557 RepID=UPI003AF125D5